MISAGPELPAGDFADTHFGGAGIDYTRSNKRFGKNIPVKQKISLVYGAGGSIYFGRKETVSGYSYKYPLYLLLKSSGGIIYSLNTQFNFLFTFGPAVGFYDGNTKVNLNSKLESSYFLNEKFAITPGIYVFKEISKADPLLVISLKGSVAF